MENQSLADDADAIVISMNPNSGSSDRRQVVEELAAELERRGFQVQLETDIETVKSCVVELMHASRLRVVVAAGGDGTVSLLANCLPPQTPIAILPLGTENLLAKYLALKTDASFIADLIVSGKTVRLDAGRANGRLFLVMASCGFDADVVHRLHANRKGHIRHWSYAGPILGAIRQYRYPSLRIYMDEQLDGEETSFVSAKWAFLFNVPRYAMNIPFKQDADPTDGRLDLCTFRGGNLARGLFYLAGVVLKRHRGWRHSHFQQFSRLRIESDGQVPYQLDGDPGGVLPLEIEVMPQFLNLVVPPSLVIP